VLPCNLPSAFVPRRAIRRPSQRCPPRPRGLSHRCWEDPGSDWASAGYAVGMTGIHRESNPIGLCEFQGDSDKILQLTCPPKLPSFW